MFYCWVVGIFQFLCVCVCVCVFCFFHMWIISLNFMFLCLETCHPWLAAGADAGEAVPDAPHSNGDVSEAGDLQRQLQEERQAMAAMLGMPPSPAEARPVTPKHPANFQAGAQETQNSLTKRAPFPTL